MPTLWTRVVNALRPERAESPKSADAKLAPPGLGRIVYPRQEDIGNFFETELTPSAAKRILKAAAYGDPADLDGLITEMLQKDAHLHSVSRTRTLALTGLPWELITAEEAGQIADRDEKAAERSLEFCREVFADLRGFGKGLDHLAEATGRGTSVCEIVWDSLGGKKRPVMIEPVAHAALHEDSQAKGRLRISLEGDNDGIAVDEAERGKFLVHTPRALSGVHFTGGLFVASVLGHMAKRYGWKWWQMGLERFGVPFRVLKYPQDKATAEDKRDFLRMLEQMGAFGGGILPIGCEIEFVESANKGEWPHERIMKYTDASYSKLWLGATLVVEVGETGGANAAAQTQNEVRADLRADDIAKEGETIREQLLRPLVEIEFGPGAPVPCFRRVVEVPKDLKQTADLISIVVNEFGADVPARVVEDELGIPLVDDADKDAPLPGRSTGFDSFGGFDAAANSRTPGGRRVVNRRPQPCGCGDHHAVRNRRITAMAQARRSAVGRVAGWIASAATASQTHTQNVLAAVGEYLDQAGSAEAALAGLPDLIARLPIEDLVTLETRLFTAAQLAGRTHSRGRIAVKAANSARASNRAKLERVANAAQIDFASIPFVQAIESLRDRLGLDPETFADLEAAARSRAWRVAGVWNMQLLADIHTALLDTIAAGESARDLRLRLPEMADRRGWTGETPWHSDIVHYQNFAMAHAAGRYSEYEEFGVDAWRYVAHEQSCPICEPVVGKVFARSDRRYFPPLHFWCDCEDEPVFEDELQPGELQSSQGVRNPALDAEQQRRSGFKWDAAQYANLEPLRLSGFPEDLRGAFRRFGEGRGWEVVE